MTIFLQATFEGLSLGAVYSLVAIGLVLVYKATDVLSFAFFCRERNLIALEKNYSNLKIRKGLGISFHITPANIPTNFAYSLIFGLLSGNCNIVKVPSKNFPQIEIICKEINRTLSRFPKLKDHIKIIRY